MIDMRRILMTVAIAAAAVLGTSSAATAQSLDSTPSSKIGEMNAADLEMQIQYRGYNRVCCKRGYRDWWSTYRQCRRSGGYVTANRACRDGRVGSRDYRVCCKRGYRDWWSTARECRRSGGYITANRACRRG